jgi:hypothetical protein
VFSLAFYGKFVGSEFGRVKLARRGRAGQPDNIERSEGRSAVSGAWVLPDRRTNRQGEAQRGMHTDALRLRSGQAYSGLRVLL